LYSVKYFNVSEDECYYDEVNSFPGYFKYNCTNDGVQRIPYSQYDTTCQTPTGSTYLTNSTCGEHPLFGSIQIKCVEEENVESFVLDFEHLDFYVYWFEYTNYDCNSHIFDHYTFVFDECYVFPKHIGGKTNCVEKKIEHISSPTSCSNALQIYEEPDECINYDYMTYENSYFYKIYCNTVSRSSSSKLKWSLNLLLFFTSVLLM